MLFLREASSNSVLNVIAGIFPLLLYLIFVFVFLYLDLKKTMETVVLDLLPGHCRRLADGKVVHLQSSMIGKGMEVKVSKPTASRIRRASRLGTGVRLSMSPEEIEASGGKLTWKGFKKGLKTGWNVYKKYVKPVLGPLIRAGIKAAAKAAPAAAASVGAPELAPLAPIAEEAVLNIGTETGAFGRKKTTKKSMKGGAKKKTMMKKHMSTATPSVIPARKPLIDVGSVEYGRDLIRGSGLSLGGGLYLGGASMGANPSSWTHAGPAPFISTSAPAMNPLIQLGDLQHGSMIIKST